MAEVSEEQIRERAYRIWIDEGCPEGCADEHWRRAADELEGEMTSLQDVTVNPTLIVPPTR